MTLSYLHRCSVFVRTGENYSNTLRKDAYFFLNVEKTLRFKKYPDTCGQGLNVTNWRYFKLTYSISLKLSNVSNFFSGVEFYLKDRISVQEKKKEVVAFCSRPPLSRCSRAQWRLRNVQKSVMHVQSCCFVYLIYCLSSLYRNNNVTTRKVITTVKIWTKEQTPLSE